MHYIALSASHPDPIAKTIWTLKLPAKMKFHLWRLHHQSLPVAACLARFIPTLLARCVICGMIQRITCIYLEIVLLRVWLGLSSSHLHLIRIMRGFSVCTGWISSASIYLEHLHPIGPSYLLLFFGIFVVIEIDVFLIRPVCELIWFGKNYLGSYRLGQNAGSFV